MATYRELLSQVKGEIEEIDAAEGARLLGSDDAPLFLDVREQDEWDQGIIPALFTFRAEASSRVSRAASTDRAIVVYCSAGHRSAFAAKTLEELGYDNVLNLSGGFTEWKRNGFPTELPRGLQETQRTRYSRHLLIPEVGEEGQLRLLDSRILLIGAGGLGSPASLYLAAAGVGTLGSSTTTPSTRRTSSARSSTRRAARRLEGRVGEENDRGSESRRPPSRPSRSA